MKVKKTFKCERCGEDIEYGDSEACSYGGMLFCCEECVHGYLYIEDYPWDAEQEFEYTPDESNGYGVCYYGGDWFSNGRYVIFDKFRLEIDADEREYFEIVSHSNLKQLLEKFNDCELKHSIIGGNISFGELLIDDEAQKYIRFILSYTGNQTGSIQYSIKDDKLLLISNGIKSIICIMLQDEGD